LNVAFDSRSDPLRFGERSFRSWACGAYTDDDLEAHYMAGGNVVCVANALISGDKANTAMSFTRLAADRMSGIQ
jgi:uncharacterized protein YqfA (UPF0365 family)